MSALPSPLSLVQVDRAPAALIGIESTKTRAIQPRMILQAVGEQVRALFLAQRSLSGQFASAAWAAEDDYRRFSNPRS